MLLCPGGLPPIFSLMAPSGLGSAIQIISRSGEYNEPRKFLDARSNRHMLSSLEKL